jgi:molybdopterin/thiamine biosynthesis adenylyltransferase
MADGRLVRRQPSRLQLFLKDNEPPLATGQDVSFHWEDTTPSSRHEPDYHTAESDPRKLTGGEVTILGAGSVGSYLAWFLAVLGLVLNVIDPKRVEYKHVRGGRTAYDSASVGLFKVEALKRKIEADHLGATVRTYPFNVAEITTLDLKDMFERSLVVVVVIDDPEQILRVSDLAYPMVEVVQAAMHAQGRTSHIAISVPLLAPCLRCTLGISESADITRLDSEPAHSLDIMNLAAHAARFVSAIAFSKVTGQPITRWDVTKNLIYIANTREELSPDGPGLHFEGSQRRPGCPICSNLP